MLHVRAHVLCTYSRHCGGKTSEPSEQQDQVFCFFSPWIKPGGWWFPAHLLSFCPSISPSADHLNCQTAQFQQAAGTAGL